MRVLIAGGAGYIGSHVACALSAAGFVPVTLDSLVTGHRWAVKYGPFVQGDVADVALVRAACETYRPVALMHFAAFIEVAESVADPEKYRDNNVRKAGVLFETALACGVAKTVFSSTAAVYGAPQTEAALTESHPLRPINPYGETKLAAETKLRDMEGEGMRSVALRYFNAAGAAPAQEGIGEAHDPETHLIPNLIRAVLQGPKGSPVRLFGTDYSTPDGTAVRDYVHVLDLAQAHVDALRYLLEGGRTDVCNLGTGVGSSVREVVAAVERASGKTVPAITGPRRAGDPPRLVADPSRAGEKLGWRPQRTLDEAAASAWQWHRSRGVFS